MEGASKDYIYYVFDGADSARRNRMTVKTTKAKSKILSPNLFPVVGIGASAGGLDAFKKLLHAIPENSGMAYVLVQHLAPNHESLLPELLQRVTTIPVVQTTDDIKVLPNHIYIIPSNKMMEANNGVLQLTPRASRPDNTLNHPIDLFFKSLAEVYQSHAIGVVLSGTATDGTKGLKAIKDYGGITFAQDEASAAFEGMPHSAVQAGVVDFILPPEKIPQKLLEIIGITNANGGNDQTLPQQEGNIYKQILSLLRIRKGTDFTYYKQTTIRRRILRRMALNNNEELATYLKFLRDNKPEQDILYQDLLIPVTSFFRDQKVFENLRESIFPHIVKSNSIADTAATEFIRIWVAGCSTGQEAYSIAICFKEFLISEGGHAGVKVQIFASDISEPAIAKARMGIYTKTEVEGLSPQRLKDFFTKINGNYQVNKQLRDMCVFAVHNFLKDPPFGKMNFISCRNVLIYMEPFLQKKALTIFHYALNPKAFLLLGQSETISCVPELFSMPTDGLQWGKDDKLFIRKSVPGRFLPAPSQRTEKSFYDLTTTSSTSKIMNTDFQKMADDIMLSQYTPACVVVNEAMDIVHFRGNTGAYLEQAPGKPSHNLLKMAKDGLGFELRTILHKAKKNTSANWQANTPVVKENISVQLNGSQHLVTIEVFPILNNEEPHYLILFYDTVTTQKPKTRNTKTSAQTKKDDKDLRIQKLEQELAQSREDMRSITEDQEAANEELQSSNEEILSGSEELQSLNEELETSKEELQSTNEELTILNHELISLNEQVTDARNYAEAIISTMHEPMLVLGKDLLVKSANKAFYKQFAVREEETEGVPVYELGNKQWNIPKLRELLETIIPKNSNFHDFEVEHTFETIGKKIMLLNASRIIQKANREQLILLSIADLTEVRKLVLEKSLKEKEALELQIETQKKIEEAYKIANANVRNLFLEAPAVIGVLRGPQHVHELANEMYLQLAGRDVLGKSIREALPELEGQGFFELLDNVYTTGEPFIGNELPAKLDKGNGKLEEVYLNFVYQPSHNSEGEITGILVHAVDVTEQVLARKTIEASEKRYNMMLMQSPFAFAVLKGKDMVVAMANDSIKQIWDKGEKIEGKPLIEILPEIKDQEFPALLHKVYTTGIPYLANESLARVKRKGKMEDVYFNFVYQPYRETDETISGVTVIAIEVTNEVIAKKKIKANEEQLQNILLQAPAAIAIFDGPRHRFIMANQAYQKQNNRKEKDFLGKSFREVFPELEGTGSFELFDSVYTTGETFTASEYAAMIDSDNNGIPKQRYFNFSLEALKNESKEIYGVMVMAYDITEQVESRKKIEASEKRYNRILMQSPFAFSIMKGKDMVITHANDLIKDFWGKGNDVEGKTLLEVLPELKGQPFPEMMDSVYTTGKSISANEIFARLNRNGSIEEHYFNLTYQPHFEGDETISGVITIAHEVTEQVLAHKKIEESEFRYHNMIDTSSSLISILKGEDMIVKIANDAILESWGKGKDIIGKPLFELMPEAAEQGFDKLLMSVYKTGVAVQAYESPVTLLRNGIKELVYYNFIYQAQRNVDGEIEGVAIIATEVTPQAEFNLKIKASEQQFRSLVTQAPVAICILKGKEFTVEVANEDYLQIVGKAENEFVGKPLFDSVPETRSIAEPLLLEVLKTGVPYFGNELEIDLHRNGKTEKGFYNFVYQPINGNDGTVTGIIVVANEITEQVLARKKVEVQNQLFNDMLMTAPGFVATLSGPDHVHELVNARYQSLFGKRHLQGKPLMVALPELEGQGFDTLLDKVYNTGQTYVGIEISITFARDENLPPEERYFNFSYQPMFDENKKIFSILVFGYDVTAEVVAKNKTLADEKLYANELEEKVQHRTVELSEANELLLQKNNELGKMNEELQSFTYIAGHDMQEPLRKIQTFASRLLEKENENLSDNGKDYFKRMNLAAKRMQALIEDLLTYSRINSTELKFEITDLRKLAEDVKNELRETIHEKQATVETHELSEARFIPFQFRQLLVNLIGNSLKFSKPGKPPHIVVKSEILKGSALNKEIFSLHADKFNLHKNYYHISVSDNGIGFDPQFKDRIFQVFQRLHGKEEYPGTGIGLAIVKKIVDTHKGIVIAKGEINKGATFDIYVPAT